MVDGTKVMVYDIQGYYGMPTHPEYTDAGLHRNPAPPPTLLASNVGERMRRAGLRAD